ncbi:MAG: hypothetical protein AB1938_32935 [Myxococcota bacterium]
MKTLWALTLLALALTAGTGPKPEAPAPRRAREVHRAATKRPLVRAPPRLTRHR